MKVILADNYGFCPGVKNAINMAEKILAKGENVYCLGSIIHNKDVIDALTKKGLNTVDNIDEISSGTVLIRSHGAAPQQINKLKAKKLKIVDATCVLVKRVQQIARKLEKDGYEVVVIGDKNHPEVQAVVGYLKEAIVINSIHDLHNLPKKKKLGVICQTTQGPKKFSEIIGNIAKTVQFTEMKIINTLCKETIKRQVSAIELCKKVDIMFVLGGLESANTQKLAELCKKYNKKTFHLQNWKEFDKRLLFGKKVAGVTAGASTPKWVIDDFVKKLKAFKR